VPTYGVDRSGAAGGSGVGAAGAFGVDRSGTAGGSSSCAAVLKPDGSVALTANWDAGSYTIKSATFESDVATGTAPFTITSTTVCANLNADLLDGSHASTYFTSGDHGTLTGLGNDDHTRYALVDGTRALTSAGLVISKANPRLKLKRSADTGQDSEIRFCESDGDARFSLLFGATDSIIGRYSSSAAYQSAAFRYNSSGLLELQVDSNNSIFIGGGATASELRFMEASGNGTNYAAFKAQAMSGNVTYTLPAVDGMSSANTLQTNGSGVLSWGLAPVYKRSAASSLNGNSSVTITGIPTGSQQIIVCIDSAMISNSANLTLRVGTSGGIDSTHYDTMAMMFYGSYYNQQATLTDRLPFEYGNWSLSSTDHICGHVVLNRVDSGSDIWAVDAYSVAYYSTGSSMIGSGYTNPSANVDRVQVALSYGTFSAGYMTVLYR